MYELFLNNAWLYMKTDKLTAKDAFDQIQHIMEQNGIELYVTEVTLRNDNGEDIEVCDGNA